MSNNKTIVKGGMSGSTFWFIIIVVLKIVKVVEWSWGFTLLVALAPSLFLLGITLIIGFVILFAFLISSLKDYVKKNKTTRNEYH